MRALILTAGTGSRFGADMPKALIRFAGKSLLEWQLEVLHGRVNEVGLVVGYRAELFRNVGHPIFHNPQYAHTNMVASLISARQWLDGSTDLLAFYGDILYEPSVIEPLFAAEFQEITIPVNTHWRQLWEARFRAPLLDAETLRISNGRVTEIGRRPEEYSQVEAQYMGILLFPKAVHARILSGWQRYRSDRRMSMTEFIDRLVSEGVIVRAVPVRGGWLEFDTPQDMAVYESMLRAGTLARLIELPMQL